MTPPLSSQTVLGDRYALDERIATGGMGEVWRGTDQVLGRTVAVKVLKPEYLSDLTFLRRFRDEARHTAALSHPGIANTFDYGELTDEAGLSRAFLVMEYVAGEPLSAILASAGALPADRALDIVGQAGLALQAAHESGVVHRDVKPGNLLVRPDGVVKVTDFGIARAVDAAPVTQTGIVVGTAAYLSPEQAAGKPLTAACDIYSLGVVAYECLSGRRPFDDASAVGVALAHINDAPPPLAKDVPPLVNDFVMRALDKDPVRRQPSAGDFGRTALALATTLRSAPPTVATSHPSPPTKVLPEADVPSAESPGYDDAFRRRIRNIFIAVGAVVVIAGFLALRSCDTASTGKAKTVPQPSPTPSAVSVVAADYVGHPAAQVAAALRALGLHVSEQSVSMPGGTGNVVGVSPTGSLPRGSTVVLTVITAPSPPAQPQPPSKNKHDKGGDNGDH